MKDPRLVPVEIAVMLLQEVPQKLLRGVDLKQIRAEAQTIVYSFMSLEDLAEQGMLDGLVAKGRELASVWKELRERARSPSDALNAAKVRFAAITLEGLPNRVGREQRLYSGIDSFWGTVISVKSFDGLRATVVDAGERFDVVTNLQVKEEETMAFAILPPKRFDSHVSEGMFIEAEGEGKSGQPAVPTERGKGAIEAILREEAARLRIKI
ncbi:MAG: hypothetical protein QI197_05705 [Candidatus Korarchaeota archaeon]|nr:hypothetical protein [Candidatus Korarchaeota archaeon]